MTDETGEYTISFVRSFIPFSLHALLGKKRMCVNCEKGAYEEVKFLSNRELKRSYNGIDFPAVICFVRPLFPSPSSCKKKYCLISVRTTQIRKSSP